MTKTCEYCSEPVMKMYLVCSFHYNKDQPKNMAKPCLKCGTVYPLLDGLCYDCGIRYDQGGFLW